MLRARRSFAIGLVVLLVSVCLAAEESGRKVLSPDTEDSLIIHMDPKKVDPSLLPLDDIDDLNTTGRPVEVDIAKWRLKIKGKGVPSRLELDFQELMQMPREKRKVLLICPSFFADYAEWEGPSLDTILERARAKGEFKGVRFRGLDGYTAEFKRDELDEGFLFLALKVNGEWLPEKHGYPARLVAEDFYGGRWVKWISEIEVY
jgi:sulfoxide reductase catalytic subunit YedY